MDVDLPALPTVAPFIQKTFNMLQEEGNGDTVRWGAAGASLVIVKLGEFTDVTLPRYFAHHSCTSFIRQLNLYGFSKIRKGEEGMAEFAHPLFHRESEAQGLLGLLTRRVGITKMQNTPTGSTSPGSAGLCNSALGTKRKRSSSMEGPGDASPTGSHMTDGSASGAGTPVVLGVAHRDGGLRAPSGCGGPLGTLLPPIHPFAHGGHHQVCGGIAGRPMSAAPGGARTPCTPAALVQQEALAMAALAAQHDLTAQNLALRAKLDDTASRSAQLETYARALLGTLVSSEDEADAEVGALLSRQLGELLADSPKGVMGLQAAVAEAEAGALANHAMGPAAGRYLPKHEPHFTTGAAGAGFTAPPEGQGMPLGMPVMPVGMMHLPLPRIMPGSYSMGPGSGDVVMGGASATSAPPRLMAPLSSGAATATACAGAQAAVAHAAAAAAAAASAAAGDQGRPGHAAWRRVVDGYTGPATVTVTVATNGVHLGQGAHVPRPSPTCEGASVPPPVAPGTGTHWQPPAAQYFSHGVGGPQGPVGSGVCMGPICDVTTTTGGLVLKSPLGLTGTRACPSAWPFRSLDGAGGPAGNMIMGVGLGACPGGMGPGESGTGPDEFPFDEAVDGAWAELGWQDDLSPFDIEDLNLDGGCAGGANGGAGSAVCSDGGSMMEGTPAPVSV